MMRALAPMFLLLAACSAPQPPAPSAPAPEAAAAKRTPDQAPADPMRIFRAFGTEPFWSVNVEDTRLTYTTPEDQAGVVMVGTRRALADGVEITGERDGKPFVLTVSSGTCSDGMSDNTYSLVSTFRFGEVDYKGCGEAAK